MGRGVLGTVIVMVRRKGVDGQPDFFVALVYCRKRVSKIRKGMQLTWGFVLL